MYKTTEIYKKDSDYKIKADIYKGKGNDVLMVIHGGALILGNRESILPNQLEAFLELGLNVVSIDYRMAPETKIKYILEDIYDAIEFVRAKYSGKLLVLGSSAGGYLSLMTGIFDNRPDAIVSFYGYGDITSKWYAKPSEFYLKQDIITEDEAYSCVGTTPNTEGGGERFKFYLYCRQQGLWNQKVVGLDPIDDLQEMKKYCSYYNVDAKYPPTLLLHGNADNDVPYQESVKMDTRLTQMGIEHNFITAYGMGHGFDGNITNVQTIEAFDEVLRFLKSKMHDCE